MNAIPNVFFINCTYISLIFIMGLNDGSFNILNNILTINTISSKFCSSELLLMSLSSTTYSFMDKFLKAK